VTLVPMLAGSRDSDPGAYVGSKSFQEMERVVEAISGGEPANSSDNVK